MGADVVIAVDLNSGLVSRKQRERLAEAPSEKMPPPEYRNEMAKKLSTHYAEAESTFTQKIRSFLNIDDPTPDIMETVSGAIGKIGRASCRERV